MGNITFYCTRCRRLTKFPATCREAIVRCPYCQQALIVPSIPADGERDLETPTSKASVPPPYGNEVPGSDARGYYVYNAADSGVLVHSHLNREKSRRIVPVAGEPSSSWSDGGFGSSSFVPLERDSSVFHTPSADSDADFIARLSDDERGASPVLPAVPPPLAPGFDGSFYPTTLKEESATSARFQYVVVSVALLATVALGSVIGVLAYRAGRSNAIAPTLAPSEPISVEGRVVYRDKSGREEGDEGALLFFFPAKEAFDKPLIVSDLSPQNAESGEYEEIFNELKKKGGYFSTVGFDGYFSLDVAEPGDYRLLIVSKHVEDSVDAADKQTIAEISKYLFLPERKLLARNRFLWSTETINEQSGAIEKDFGKSANGSL